MKVRIVKDNLMVELHQKFSILFHDDGDPEFGFQADDKLITYFLSSLSLEQTFTFSSEDQKDEDFTQEQLKEQQSYSFIPLDVVATSLYLIDNGRVDVFYQESEHALVHYDDGSYFGDISYIFKAKNQYKFKLQNKDKDTKIYSIRNVYLDPILDMFPDFKKILTVRALRRQHYMRRLHKQEIKLLAIKKELSENANLSLKSKIADFKKARLVEEKMSYEDLAMK